MDAAKVISTALNRAGRLAGNATYEGYALDELNLLIQGLERGETVSGGGFFLPWFLLTENSTTTTTVDEPRVALPADFLQEWEDSALDHLKADGSVVPLTKMPLDRLDQTVSGDPKYYALGSSYFYIAPVPATAQTLRMKYYAASVEVVAPTAGKTNGWTANAPQLLVAGVAAAIAASYLYNERLAAIERGRVQTALRALRIAHEARENANLAGSIGEDA